MITLQLIIFFNFLKRKRIQRKVHKMRVVARQDIVDYIEMLYNLKLILVRNGVLTPVEYDWQ
jgi:Integrase core domain